MVPLNPLPPTRFSDPGIFCFPRLVAEKTYLTGTDDGEGQRPTALPHRPPGTTAVPSSSSSPSSEGEISKQEASGRLQRSRSCRASDALPKGTACTYRSWRFPCLPQLSGPARCDRPPFPAGPPSTRRPTSTASFSGTRKVRNTKVAAKDCTFTHLFREPPFVGVPVRCAEISRS